MELANQRAKQSHTMMKQARSPQVRQAQPQRHPSNEGSLSRQQQQSSQIEKKYKDLRNSYNELDIKLKNEVREKENVIRENRDLQRQIKKLQEKVQRLKHKNASLIDRFKGGNNELEVIREQTETLFSDEPQTEVVKISFIPKFSKSDENVNDSQDVQTQRIMNLQRLQSQQNNLGAQLRQKASMKESSAQQQERKVGNPIQAKIGRMRSPDIKASQSLLDQHQQNFIQQQREKIPTTPHQNGNNKYNQSEVSSNSKDNSTVASTHNKSTVRNPQSTVQSLNQSIVNDNQSQQSQRTNLQNSLNHPSFMESPNISKINNVQVLHSDSIIDDSPIQYSFEFLQQPKQSRKQIDLQNLDDPIKRESSRDRTHRRKQRAVLNPIMTSSFKQGTSNIHNDISRSLVCSSISSRLSTESYLLQKNFNIVSHFTKEMMNANQEQLQNKNELMKQLSLKSQLSVMNRRFQDVSMSSVSYGGDMDERNSNLKQLPNVQQKAKTLGDYLKDRLFQEFLIVGVPLSSEKRSQMDLGKGRFMADTLFMYFEDKKTDERRRVVKDFCFPCGVSVTYQSSADFIRRQLEKDKKTQQSSCFVFSLSGTNPEEQQIFSEIYCICIQFHDFFVDEKSNQINLTEKAFCLMFNNTHFKVQQKVLITLRNMYLDSRIKILKEVFENQQNKAANKIKLLVQEDSKEHINEINMIHYLRACRSKSFMMFQWQPCQKDQQQLYPRTFLCYHHHQVIEAPVPIMIGLLREQFETLDAVEIENRLWVLLDSTDQTLQISNPILDEGEKFIYEPNLNGLKEKIQPIYEELLVIGDIDLNECEEKCLQISKLIFESLKKSIIDLGGIVNQLKKLINIDFAALEKLLLKAAHPKDVEFLQRFMKTQMFVSYLEERLLSQGIILQ
ncbi:UNKNOWN [Stylonychia lemnae]|uniref:Uncharacterized protein n=1 Tax=Stylonychia lemnae TaxID=5949 RepID=A0A078BC25_STYLE|nr:UNKNOWN [Stylonychia lemnae]|eukprot:CDW91761.1 UNKNOWN [Stylonychia lemnae]